MKKRILFLFISLLPLLGIGATTLAPGDIVIVAINGDADATTGHIYGKGFSFMTLVNLDAGTVINFTDYGWSDVNTAFISSTGSSDSFIHYTVPTGGIPAGTIIRCDANTNTNFTFDYTYAGSGTSNYLTLGSLTQSDEVLVFTGTRTSPTFIFAVTYVSTTVSSTGWATSVPAAGTDGSGSGSALPPGLTNDVTALSFNQPATANDNSAYSGVTTAATKAGWLTLIDNYSNWTFNDAAPIPTPLTGPYSVISTWTGITSTDWGTASNWDVAAIPASTTDVSIPGVTNAPVIGATTTAYCNNLTVTGSLTIQSSASGTGSLIINGTSTGTVTAERYMTGNAWHIVTPIAASGSISTFIQASGNAIPLKNVSGTNRYGMMDYNETTNTWNTYYAATTPDILPAGKGYSVRRSSDGIVTFTGDLTSGTKLVWLSMGGMGWNCIGNPYSSAIGMNTSATTTENFITKNSSYLDASYACVYIWDDATLSYKILGNVSFGTRDLLQNFIQAGQGFFVKAASDGVIVQFTNNMQVHQTGTAFRAPAVTTSWPGLTLTVTDTATTSSAVIAFNEKMTRGLDPTYDAGLLRGTNGLSLYTRLLEDNGVDFAVQCLPENYNNLVIPVGVDSKAGADVTFSAETIGLPDGCNVVLEDKTTGILTPLTGSNGYTVTLPAETSGVGRFYLKIGNVATDLSSVQSGANLKTYCAGRTITVYGEIDKAAIAHLTDMNGRLLGEFSLNKGTINVIHADGFASGFYLLRIVEGEKNYINKIILQ
jgi:hypothetical protein